MLTTAAEAITVRRGGCGRVGYGGNTIETAWGEYGRRQTIARWIIVGVTLYVKGSLQNVDYLS